MTAPSRAQIRADFHEIGQLLTCSFKLKQWIKLIDGIVTIDYVSNLNVSHNILLKVQSIKSPKSSSITRPSSYSFQMTPPFEIQQKDKTHQSQYMLKAKDLSTNESVLLAIIFKTVSIANKFYNLIVKFVSLCSCTVEII